jgi:hypothetical protein
VCMLVLLFWLLIGVIGDLFRRHDIRAGARRFG